MTSVIETSAVSSLATPLSLVQSSFLPPSTSSSNSSGQPDTSPEAVTPPPLFDFQAYLDQKSPMSPPTRAPLIHSASYTYGAEPHSQELSQVRSTADMEPFTPVHSNGHQAVKTEPHSNMGLSSHTQVSHLPPMRSVESYPWAYYHNGLPPPFGAYPTHAYPQYPQYPSTHRYQPNHHPSMHTPVFAYPYAQAHSATPSSQDVHTPYTAHYGPSGSGTVQPSAFGAWSDQYPTQSDPRRPEVTIPGNALGIADEDETRRQSASTESETKVDSPWDQPSPVPSVSLVSDEGSEYGSTPTTAARQKLKGPKVKQQKKKRIKQRALEVVSGDVTYTTDSEVKQTPELKRMCFNCEAKNPPSWRKSVLNEGRILCNKCGIFERTHRRARPPQDDDQKLRKGMGSTTMYRREAPPPLTMRHAAVSPISSAYSSVPSQATPLSGEFAFNGYQQPHHGSMPPLGMNHQSQANQAPLTSTARLSDRRHSQAHAYSHNVGSGSPYHQQYFSRRTASYQTTPTFPSMTTSPLLRTVHTGSGTTSFGVPLTAPPVGMPINYWDSGRRGSEAGVQGGEYQNVDVSNRQSVEETPDTTSNSTQ